MAKYRVFTVVFLVILTHGSTFSDEIFQSAKKVFPDLKMTEVISYFTILTSPDSSLKIKSENLKNEIKKNGFAEIGTVKFKNSFLNISFTSGVYRIDAGCLSLEILDENGKRLDQISGSVFIIPGNDFIYSYERISSSIAENVMILKKYALENSRFREVNQPFYSIDRTYTARANINAYSEASNDSKINAVIAKGIEFNVLGVKFVQNKDTSIENWFLLKTGLGILGWHKVETIEHRGTLYIRSLPFMDYSGP